MQRRIFILKQNTRNVVFEWLQKCSEGVIVEFRKPKRTIPQNSRMWAMLGDIADAKPDGHEHDPEDWKAVFMKALGHEVRFIHGLDGEVFPVGFHTSKLNKDQMSALMDLIENYANEKDITLNEGAA